MTLKAILFDWGGVLVRTHDHSLRTAWEQRLGLNAGQAEYIVFGGETGWDVQLGSISDEAHWERVQRRLGLSADEVHAFRRDFFAGDHLDSDLIAYIDRLRSHYTLGLLSNATSRARSVLAGEFDLVRHFDSVTISCEEGVMKPDVRIYQIALARAGVAPAEAVFIDDTRPNIEGAQRAGLQTVHFTDPELARRQLYALTGIA
jgi:glucose-1-phosphatase